MKKVIAKLALVLVLCASFVSAASTSALQAKSTQEAAKSALKKKLKKVYKSYVKNLSTYWDVYELNCEGYDDDDVIMTHDEFFANYPLLYAYKDINGDDIDELLVLEEYPHYDDAIRGELSIYSYVKGKVKCFTNVYDYSNKISISGPEGFENDLIFADDCKYIFVHYAVDSVSYELYKLSGKKYKRMAEYFDGEGTSCEIYDKSTKGLKDVSESEFEKYVKKALKNTCTVDWEVYK